MKLNFAITLLLVALAGCTSSENSTLNLFDENGETTEESKSYSDIEHEIEILKTCIDHFEINLKDAQISLAQAKLDYPKSDTAISKHPNVVIAEHIVKQYEQELSRVRRHLSEMEKVLSDRIERKEIVPTEDILKRAAMLKNNLIKMGDLRGDPPETIEMAKDLLFKVSMLRERYPCRWFEYDNIFFFYGYMDMKQRLVVEDFSYGYAIKKGESQLYRWSDLNTN